MSKVHYSKTSATGCLYCGTRFSEMLKRHETWSWDAGNSNCRTYREQISLLPGAFDELLDY